MFKCDMCGECCRCLDNLPFDPGLPIENGVCGYLVGNKCSIYDKRPIFCNVDELYHNFLKDKMTVQEYYELNYKYCEKLKSNKGKK